MTTFTNERQKYGIYFSQINCDTNIGNAGLLLIFARANIRIDRF